jgi:uncharacterized membrane protein SirB2
MPEVGLWIKNECIISRKYLGVFHLNWYFWLKFVHITFVSISLVLFFFRAVLTVRRFDWLGKWPVLKFLPHINDTFLLLSGFALAWYTSTSLLSGWLSAKLLLLVVYILLGSYTLKIAKNKTQQMLGMASAILTLSVMVYLAIYKTIL